MLFSYLFTLTGIKLQKHRKQMVSVIVNIGIFGILIGGIMESYNLNYLFVFLALGYYVDKLMSDQNLVMLNEKRLE